MVTFQSSKLIKERDKGVVWAISLPKEQEKICV